MRILVTSTGGGGHVGPLLPVVAAAVAAGHEVLAVAAPGAVRALTDAGVETRAGGAPPDDVLGDVMARLPTLPGPAAAELGNRVLFGRLLARAMLPSVHAALDDWPADVVLHEAAEYAGPLAATDRGLPHVQVAIGLAGVEEGSLALAAPELGPAVTAAVRASPYLTRLPASLDPSPYPRTVRHRGAAGPGGSWQAVPPGPEPLVLATLGTVVGRQPAGAAALAALVRALCTLPVRALVSTGRTVPASRFRGLPDRVRVVDWMPPLDARPGAALAVTHGGAGSTFAALEAGLPQVVVPVMADQPVNGRVVERAGAGVVVPAAGADLVARLREAVAVTLADPGRTAAAQRVAAQLRALPGLGPALDDVLADVPPRR